MRQLLQFFVLLTIGLGAAAGTAEGQSGVECPSGTSLLAKFENVDGDLVFEKPDGNDGEIDITEIQKDSEGEITGGEWTSTSLPVTSIVVFGGGTDGTTGLSPSQTEGSFDNGEIGGKEISNVRFCKSNTVCDTPTLLVSGEDQVTDGRDGVANTIQDADGIDEFTFTTLEGFEVESIDPSDGFTRTGDTWEWTGTEGDQPTSVDFTLNATESDATYFVKIYDNCEGGRKMNELDPRFTLGPLTDEARLAGTAPNPFRGRTTVEFALPEQMRVTVAVYDMMGRKVATLVDGTKGAGTHMVSWNGQSDGGQALASGVYFMRMQADGQSQTRRVTIVR